MSLISFDRPAKTFQAIMLLAAAALLLSACVEIAVESEFQSDGSARHAIATSIDRALMDEDLIGDELDFEEIEREAEAAGLDVERIDTTSRIGVRISVQVDDNEDLSDSLNRLFTSIDPEADEIDAFSGGFTTSGGGLGATRHRFELTVNADSLLEDGVDDLDEGLDMAFGMDMMRQFFNLTYTVAIPGEITEHNGTEIGGGRVQWDIPFEGTATFVAESEEGSAFPLMLIAGLAVGSLAVILVAIGAVVLIRNQRSPAAGYVPPDDAVSRPPEDHAGDAQRPDRQ